MNAVLFPKGGKMNRQNLVLASLFLLTIFAIPYTVFAITYGNPASSVAEGKFAVGLAISEIERELVEKFSIQFRALGQNFSVSDSEVEKLEFSRQTIVASFGVTDSSLIQFAFGELAIKGDNDFKGDEIGFSYRQRIGENGEKTKFGLLFSFRSALLEDKDKFSEIDVSQVDFGFGVGSQTSDVVSIFGNVLFSTLSGTQKFNSTGLAAASAEASLLVGFPVVFTSAELEFEEDSAIGLVVGAEIKPSESVFVIFEMHALFESGFGLAINFVF